MNWKSSEPRKSNSAAEGCLSPGRLLQFLQDGTECEDASDIERHLESCVTCQFVADALTSRQYWEPKLQAFRFLDSAPRGSNLNSDPCSASVNQNSISTGQKELSPPDTIDDPRVIPGESNAVIVESSASTFQPQGTEVRLSQAADQFVRFRNLKLIGRGGFAKVYLADDTVLGRMVALKFPHATLFGDPSVHKRFRTELRATAVLHHPHIVALYDARMDENQCYIVFEYIAGQTLAAWLAARTQPLDFSTAAAIAARLASGLQHAHEARILHRDLKPSNVLLDESRPSGVLPFVPLIADFGIAQFFNSDVTQTIDDHVVGSPPFMSPEQALADRARIGPASDVYALGGILYQMLTLELPIRGASVADTLRRVLTDAPIAPRRFRPDVPRDLEAVCLKCLAKEPGERYASAVAFQMDLEKFLAGEPVSVRPPGGSEIAIRTARRHPVLVSLAGLMLVGVLMFVILVSRHSSLVESMASQISEQNAQLTAKNKELSAVLTVAKSSRDSARELVYSYDMRQAFEAASVGDARMVHSLLSRYVDGSGLESFREIGWHYLSLREHHPHRDLIQAATPVYMAKLSPNGRTLAIVGEDAQIRLLEWPSGKLAEVWPSGQQEVNGVCFSPDSQQLWTIGDDGTVCSWNCETHECLYTIEAHPGNVAYEVVFDSQRHRIISCGRDAVIRIWDADTKASLGILEGHQSGVGTIQIDPDSQFLYSQSGDSTIRVWNLASLQCQQVIDLPQQQRASHIRLSPDGRWLAACTSDSELIVYDLHGRTEPSSRATMNEPTRVCFDETSQRLFVGDLLGSIEEWTMRGESGDNDSNWSRANCVWQAHGDQVSHLEWVSESDELISASRDGGVKAWSGFDQESSFQQDLQHDEVRDFTNLPGENRLLIASRDGLYVETVVADVTDGAPSDPVIVLDKGSQWNRVAVSGDGSVFAAGTETGRVAMWLRGQHKPFADVEVFAGLEIHCLTFTPDDLHVCATVRGTEQAVWLDTATGKVEVLPLANPCSRIEFAADGGTFASVFEKSLKIIDRQLGTLRCELQSPSLFGRTMLYFADGQTLALADERKVRLHDVATGRRLREFLGHKGKISGIAVSSDGRTLVTCSGEDQTVQLWHVPTGQNLTSFAIGQMPWSRCCLLNNDTRLAYSISADRIRIVRIR